MQVTFSSFPLQLHFIVQSLQLILLVHFNLLSGWSVKAAEEFDKFFLHKHVFAHYPSVQQKHLHQPLPIS